MSRTSKILLIALTLAFVCLSRICHAAVRQINETEYGFSPMLLSDPAPSADGDCSFAACESAYTGGTIKCEYHNAKEGRGCVAKSCCNGSTPVNVNECPAALSYSVTNTDDLANLSSLEYCDGYRNGVHAIYLYENPNLCSIKGITDTTYLSKLNSGSSCGATAAIGQKNCLRDDGGDVRYCELSSTSSYQACPTGDTTFSPYPHNDCGPASDEASIPCYIQCGASRYCAGYTCKTDNLPTCSSLEASKKNEGYYSSGISSVYDSTKGFINQCMDGSVVKYMGFYCKGYFTQSDCTGSTNNGTVEGECTVQLAAGGTDKVYECSCGTARTLETFCAQEHAADANCTKTYYGESSGKCTLDKDSDGNTLIKYKTFTSSVGLCEDNTNWKWVDQPAGGCANYTDETPASSENCRVLQSSGESTFKNICRYCENFIAETLAEAQAICTNGTPTQCHYTSTDVVYTGCSCDPSLYKTVAEWCQTSFASDLNCPNQAAGAGKECQSNSGDDTNTVYYEKITCNSSFSLKEDWCAANADKIASGYKCENYVGLGEPCKLDAGGDESKYKYLSYGLQCPTGADGAAFVKENESDCLVEGDKVNPPAYNYCYNKNETTGLYGESDKKYVCKCPNSYGSDCEEAYKIRGGAKCEFDRDSSGTIVLKYAKCNISCGNKYASAYSQTPYECENVDNYAPTIRGGITDPEKCVMSNDRSEYYICGCPTNFKTLEDWCEANYVEEGLNNSSECVSNYTGRGVPCQSDVLTDTLNNPIKVLTKYAYYVRFCPSNRPLYYSEEDCRYIGGEYDYSCQDSNTNERVVCQCPTNYYPTSDAEEEANTCNSQSLSGKDFDAEPSGEYCDFDGTDNLKYEECIAKCTDILSSEGVAIPNAYTYLNSDNSTPTQTMCSNQMGNGAVLGYGGQAFCSLNHSKMYPCYCPASFKECDAENNEMAAENASVCKINDKTYYSSCVPVSCKDESSTLAVVSTNTDVATVFGPGAVAKSCSKNGTEMLEVTCDSSIYTDPCDYPYEAPKSGAWCSYGDGTTLMKNGRPHYKAGACRIQKTLGECGVSIVGGDADANYSYFVATTESECKSKYGPGISVQLCEYGEDQGYKRAYNCYYDADAFKYTTANCGVRHDLTGNYIIISGKKYWKECLCASAYQHHKFNCGGLLSGNPCQQEINQDLINRDSSLKEAIDDGYNLKGKTLPFYPYCECSADYTEICDEDGSGRYKGVGQACNGKYTACECVPDPLPDNWTDNYYGCAGGKKPTGVWKDNGCGKKYYQCSVVECTWEYTEMCESPLIPVGQSCQDNQGNIGGYKACTCPTDYEICPTGQVGEGEPCMLKGVAYYKDCKSQEACTSLANETCTGPLQVGINPCTRDGVTYYESCVCANGYSEACGEGEVGVGNYCEIDGVKYFKQCTKPETNECTQGHVTACDTNQESYSPCVDTNADGKQVIKYLCKCPTNWQTCDSGTGEKCVQTNSDGSSTTYWSECNSSAEGCSAYQELTYSVCTAAQTGDGGHCTSEIVTGTDEAGEPITETVVKYATCKDSDNCLTNGFRYSCSGYDASALGESCVDANGNKLYKSCPCPSSYVTCSNPNASKGNKCVPLEASGSFGTPRYSSCECDRSKYKYTCKEEGNNKGITTPNTSNYCEVDEEVTTTTKDEETGESTTTTTMVKTKYYTSCDCKEKYKYTCSDGNSGEILPSGYDEDYCLINTTKFYKGCDCSSAYTVTANECSTSDRPGQTVDLAKGSCTVKGTVVSTSTGSDGTVTETTKPAATYYKGCICKPNYVLDCSGNEYEQTDISACAIGNNTPLYPRCKCKTEGQKTCSARGKNTGITADETSVCTEKTADNAGNIITESKYSRCTCKDEFGVPVTRCTEQHDQSREEYCDSGEDGAEIMYKQCYCNPLVYDHSKSYDAVQDAQTYCQALGMTVNTSLDSSLQFCGEIYTSGNPKFFANSTLCCGTKTGYSRLFTVQYDSVEAMINAVTTEGVEEKIKQLCGHRYNADIYIACDGYPYYKCSNTAVTKSTSWYSKEECAALDQNGSSLLITSGTSQKIENSWAKPVEVFSSCGCPSNFNKTIGCRQNTVANLAGSLRGGVNAPICFDWGRHYDDGNTWISRNSMTCESLNENNQLCIDKDGSNKYDWTKCTCGRDYYNITDSDGGLDNCESVTGSSKSCHLKYCIDGQGSIVRSNNGHRKDSGNTHDRIGWAKCRVSSGRVYCSW